ncbi:iron-containing alcohol dehydrogenase [Maridesulfovibrio zosterae]|uniref:iron-containing alcohol dehydrogenase n=1 Tax=Maridesulfovibrio zosterae TaxID=82171 RepID=UPI00040E8E32|nr:iron-containing alcohol dehydrogenase [Maridesulfovibrio zosterae]
MKFQFSTAPKIIFGPGTAKSIPDHASRMGNKICLITGRNHERTKWLIAALEDKKLPPFIITVGNEPDTNFISKQAKNAREQGCDVVIAIGGGSVLDSGKAIAALLNNQRDIYDYLEVVGKGMQLEGKSAPLIAVPTTSGTGSEVTSNAVLLSKKHGVKVSLRSTDMIPDLAIVDPVLTTSIPPKVTANTGIDALTQLMEAFVSKFSTPITSPLCKEGMAHAAASLHTAVTEGNNIEARSGMALASLFSGIALANAKLGAVHGFAAPLGGQFKAPHGAVCAALLPHVMEINIRALQERMPESSSLAAYTETARILTGKRDATVTDGVKWVKQLCTDLNISGLAEMGVTENDFTELALKAANSSSMKGNPIELTQGELIEILQLAF